MCHLQITSCCLSGSSLFIHIVHNDEYENMVKVAGQMLVDPKRSSLVYCTSSFGKNCLYIYLST